MFKVLDMNEINLYKGKYTVNFAREIALFNGVYLSLVNRLGFPHLLFTCVKEHMIN